MNDTLTKMKLYFLLCYHIFDKIYVRRTVFLYVSSLLLIQHLQYILHRILPIEYYFNNIQSGCCRWLLYFFLTWNDKIWHVLSCEKILPLWRNLRLYVYRKNPKRGSMLIIYNWSDIKSCYHYFVAWRWFRSK